MSNLDTELFIRRQIQRILLREEKEPDKEEKPKRRGPGKVLGGTGQGRYPDWVKEIFAGEDGSVAKAKRLAAVNPGKLMSNIGARNGQGISFLVKLLVLVKSKNATIKKAIFTPMLVCPKTDSQHYLYLILFVPRQQLGL